MAEYAPIKLLVQETDKEPKVLSFEQKMIKIGRGARKGVDVQLEDPKVARVHAVINVKAKDATIMDMGSKTFIDGKKAGAKGKLKNGCIIQVGETSITFYIGEEALSFDPLQQEESVAEPNVPESQQEAIVEEKEYDEEGYDIEEERPVGASQVDLNASPIDTTNDPQDSWNAPQISNESHFNAVESSNQTTPAPVSFSSTFDSSANDSQLQIDTSGYILHPMHTASMTYGPYGPTPPPLPEQFAPSLPMLLEVFDRLNKEVWYVQDIIW